MGDAFLGWYSDLPPVTRFYLTSCAVVTGLCALDVITPFHMYYNYHAIAEGGQYWRLATNFLFFGSGLDWIFHMWFLVRYSRELEEGYGHARWSDFAATMFAAAFILLCIAPHTPVLFLGSSLSSALVYLWARRHHGLQLALFGLVNFTAPYLPWALLVLGVAVGNDPLSDILGILVGHLLFFAEDVFPQVALARGWSITALVPNPTNCVACVRYACKRRRTGVAGGAVTGRIAPPPPIVVGDPRNLPRPAQPPQPIGFDNN